MDGICECGCGWGPWGCGCGCGVLLLRCTVPLSFPLPSLIVPPLSPPSHLKYIYVGGVRRGGRQAGRQVGSWQGVQGTGNSETLL